MKIKRVVVGLLKTNCYVLVDKGKAIVIDPGDEMDRIKKAVGLRKIVGVLLTHNHLDHARLIDEFDPKIVYRFDNLEEKEYKVGPFVFEVIFTPGHTKDSVSFYFREENVLFGGDFVFRLGIGRSDLGDGDYKEILRSVDKIKEYPKDMIIYPGHGTDTTLKYEMKNSLYFNRKR